MRYPHRANVFRFWLGLLTFFALSGAPLHAADGETRPQRGFAPNQVYQVGELDAVNVSNGNVMVRIPIGHEYAAGPSLRYQLALTYNSKVWDYEYSRIDTDDRRESTPEIRSNAGFGWLLSLGHLVLKPLPGYYDDIENYTYVAPDGAETALGVHALDEQNHARLWYGYNGTVLRMRRVNMSYELDFPNGDIHTFDSNGNLTGMKDRFGNWVSIAISTDGLLWTITDGLAGMSAQRTHTIEFEDVSGYPLPAPANFLRRVTSADLDTFGGTPAHYEFHYTDHERVGKNRAVITGTTPCVEASLLRSITLPDGQTYDADYNLVPQNDNCASNEPNTAAGTLSSLTLPSHGTITWQYGTYAMNMASCYGVTSDFVYVESTAGVVARTYNDGNNHLSTWTYSPYLVPFTNFFEGKGLCGSTEYHRLDNVSAEFVNVVRSPDGLVTKHYFSAWPKHPPLGQDVFQEKYKSDHFGLPFTGREQVGDRYLSTEVFDCSSGCQAGPNPDLSSKTPLRKTYLAYARKPLIYPQFEDTQMVVGQRTQFVENGTTYYTDTTNLQPDLYGYFGQSITKNNYLGAEQERTTTIQRLQVADGSTWLLDLPTSTSVETRIGAGPITRTKTTATYDPVTGFRNSVRTLTNGVDDQDHDLLTVLCHDGLGFVTSERFSGGDGMVAEDSCASTSTDGRFILNHTWIIANGKLTGHRAQWAGTTFLAADETYDPHSGLVSSTRDSAGIETRYEYDFFGRLTALRPEDQAWTRYRYDRTTSPIATHVDVWPENQAAGIGNALREDHYFYDGLGRLILAKTQMADGKWSATRTDYDIAGRVSKAWTPIDRPDAAFEFIQEHYGDETVYGTKTTYDVFGRPLQILSPDYDPVTGSGGKVEFSYAGGGDRQRTRTQSVWDGAQIIAAPVTEEYDGRGHLVRVTENSGTNAASVLTSYAYDGDQLRTVTIGGSQSRTFLYDGRGLLLSEQHPESGTTSYKYNARGQVTLKTSPVQNSDLQFTYDAAGRPVTVEEGSATSGFRPLKIFEYGTENGSDDWRKGKLWKATRINYPPTWTSTAPNTRLDTIDVTETYRYPRLNGVKTERTTKITSNSIEVATFEQGEEYNELGLPETVTYPKAIGTTIPGRLSVTTNYNHGQITSLSEGLTGIEWDASGAWKSRSHSDGTKDVQKLAFGLPRPAEINFELPEDCNLITQQPADISILPGAPAQLTVVAPNATSFQWYKGARGDKRNPVNGQTTNQLNLAAVTITSTYWCLVKTTSCVELSEIATIRACDPPEATITTSASAVAGLASNASIPDAGSNATYTWTIDNGTILTGADTNAITFLPTGCAGTVTLTVTVETCELRTSTVAVNVVAPSALVNGVVTVGNEKRVQVLLSGAGPWVLQWSDGFTQNVNAGATSVERVVNPPVKTTYTITSITEAGTHCPATASGSAVVAGSGPTGTCASAEWATKPVVRFSTILQNEATQLSAALVQKQGNDLRYHFQWYEDGVLDEQALDLTTPSDLHTVRFVDQTFVRVDAWISCYDATENRTVNSNVVSATSYGSIFGHCPVPEIIVDETEVALNSESKATLSPNVPYALSAAEPPGTYQWYRGESGNTRETVWQGTSPTLEVTEAGAYWLRVTTDCGTHNDGPTITVSSATCSPVRITSDLQDSTTTAGAKVTLSIGASAIPAPNKYVWSTPAGNFASGTPSVDVYPKRTTDYAVRVDNACRLTYSRWARVHVTSCGDIQVIAQPADLSIPEGQSATLTINANAINASAGAPLRYQWYVGESGDTSNPVATNGTSASLTLADPVTQKYWVRLSFDDPSKCAIDSRTATIDVCKTPIVSGQSEYTNLVPNVRVLLTVDKVGENLTTQWFRGEVDDETDSVLAPYGVAPVWPTATTKYWAKVTSDCTTPQSDRVVKYPVRVSVCPTFNAAPVAAKSIVASGESTTITVNVARGDLVKWFMTNASGVTTELAQPGPTLTTPAITGRTTFYARATSGSCTMDSDPVTIDICSKPTVHWSGGLPTQVATNESFWLSAGVGVGETASWKWYRGPVSDVANSTLLYQSSNSMQVAGITSTTSYWARATDETTGCYRDTTLHTVSVCVPTITASPQSQTINSGSSATLTASADLPNMHYQWYRGAAGDTSNPLFNEVQSGLTSTLTVTPTVTTQYWARVTGCRDTGQTPATRDTAVATITICQPPAITSQPVGQWASGPVTLTVTATGTELTYQWYKGIAPDTSQPQASTTSTLDVNPSQTTNYWVRISGRCGTINSNTAKISKTPTITTHPAGGVITKGTTRALTVAASGTELSYLWYERPATGSPIAITTATSASFTPPAVQANVTYFARVSSGVAFANSNDATFTVCLPREINVVGYPSGVSGTQVTLQVIDPAAGEQFEWYRGASGVTSDPAGTGTSITVAPTVTTQYWVRTKRTGCDADSAAVTINICYPAITTQPASSIITSGSTKTLTVAVTGTAPLVYQWYRGAAGDTSVPVGTNSNSFTTPALTSTTTYWVRISTNAGVCSGKFVNSTAATVTVCQPPAITSQPQSNIVAKNTQNTLTITATGDALHYQWYLGEVGVTTSPVGTDSNSFTFSTTATRTHWVRVTGACGSVDSIAAVQSVKPTITQQPTTADICGVGGTATFDFMASGADRYEWQRDGVTVGNTRTLTIAVPNTNVTFRGIAWSGAASIATNSVGVNVLPVPAVASFTATQETSTRWLLKVTDSEVDSSVLRYRFYEGALGDTTTLLVDGTLSYLRVTPASRPKTYWVAVYYTSNGCATNRAVTIP